MLIMNKIKYFLGILVVGIFFFSSCEKKEKDPSIITLTAYSSSVSQCKASARISEFGTYAISDYGFVYYLGSNDNLSNVSYATKVSLGKSLSADTFAANFSLTNSYSSPLSSYKWYVRAYVTNEKGILYGNAVSFDPIVMSLQSISPSVGKVGDTISIYGNNFDPSTTNNQVSFYYYYTYYSAKVVEASQNKLRVIVPSFSSGSYDNYSDIIVTCGSQSKTLTDAFSFLPTVSGFSPSSGTFGTAITITGSNMNQLSGIMLGDVTITSYSSYSNYVTFWIPNNIASKKSKIYILKGNQKLEIPGGEFTMNKPTITSLSTNKAYIGNTFTVNGTNFNSSYFYNYIFIGTTKFQASSSYTSYMSITIPSGLAAGEYPISVTNGVDTVVASSKINIVVPTITGISPGSGNWGSDLIISGHNFNTNYSSVYFGGTGYSTYSYDSTTYKIKVPSYLTPGTYKISLYTGASYVQSPADFTILAPTLTSLSPTSGGIGTAVVITGDGFGTGNTVSVKFGSQSAAIVVVNNNQINALVPSGLSSGNWLVTVTINNYTITKSLNFTIP